MIVLRHCSDSFGNSMSGFELINNLNDTILAKCTDYSAIHAKGFDSNTFHAKTLYTIQE